MDLMASDDPWGFLSDLQHPSTKIWGEHRVLETWKALESEQRRGGRSDAIALAEALTKQWQKEVERDDNDAKILKMHFGESLLPFLDAVLRAAREGRALQPYEATAVPTSVVRARNERLLRMIATIRPSVSMAARAKGLVRSVLDFGPIIFATLALSQDASSPAMKLLTHTILGASVRSTRNSVARALAVAMRTALLADLSVNGEMGYAAIAAASSRPDAEAVGQGVGRARRTSTLALDWLKDVDINKNHAKVIVGLLLMGVLASQLPSFLASPASPATAPSASASASLPSTALPAPPPPHSSPPSPPPSPPPPPPPPAPPSTLVDAMKRVRMMHNRTLGGEGGGGGGGDEGDFLYPLRLVTSNTTLTLNQVKLQHVEDGEGRLEYALVADGENVDVPVLEQMRQSLYAAVPDEKWGVTMASIANSYDVLRPPQQILRRILDPSSPFFPTLGEVYDLDVATSDGLLRDMMELTPDAEYTWGAFSLAAAPEGEDRLTMREHMEERLRVCDGVERAKIGAALLGFPDVVASLSLPPPPLSPLARHAAALIRWPSLSAPQRIAAGVTLASPSPSILLPGVTTADIEVAETEVRADVQALLPGVAEADIQALLPGVTMADIEVAAREVKAAVTSVLDTLTVSVRKATQKGRIIVRVFAADGRVMEHNVGAGKGGEGRDINIRSTAGVIPDFAASDVAMIALAADNDVESVIKDVTKAALSRVDASQGIGGDSAGAVTAAPASRTYGGAAAEAAAAGVAATVRPQVLRERSAAITAIQDVDVGEVNEMIDAKKLLDLGDKVVKVVSSTRVALEQKIADGEEVTVDDQAFEDAQKALNRLQVAMKGKDADAQPVILTPQTRQLVLDSLRPASTPPSPAAVAPTLRTSLEKIISDVVEEEGARSEVLRELRQEEGGAQILSQLSLHRIEWSTAMSKAMSFGLQQMLFAAAGKAFPEAAKAGGFVMSALQLMHSGRVAENPLEVIQHLANFVTSAVPVLTGGVVDDDDDALRALRLLGGEEEEPRSVVHAPSPLPPAARVSDARRVTALAAADPGDDRKVEAVKKMIDDGERVTASASIDMLVWKAMMSEDGGVVGYEGGDKWTAPSSLSAAVWRIPGGGWLVRRVEGATLEMARAEMEAAEFRSFARAT